MAKDLLVFIGQKAFIQKDNQVLVLLASFGLDFPGGKIQEGDTNFTEALKREVREETRLEIEVGEAFTTWSVSIREGHKNAGKTIYLVGFKCKYTSGEVALSHEHVNFRWVNKQNYHELHEDTMTFKALEKYFSNFSS